MPTRLGAHSARLADVRALHAGKGRRERGRFAFEGATLLEEAFRSGVAIEELYATQSAYETTPLIADIEAAGAPTFVIDDRAATKISDVTTPSGILAVSAIRFTSLEAAFGGDGVVLVLADLNDPGNAGTLLRAADAFACRAVVFGRLGADPYQPKVVRAAMGALFRVPVAVADPHDVATAAAAGGFEPFTLQDGGEPIGGLSWPVRTLLAVGHERHGIARWSALGGRPVAIPMRGPAESLNAAVAGSIALYEATRGAPA